MPARPRLALLTAALLALAAIAAVLALAPRERAAPARGAGAPAPAAAAPASAGRAPERFAGALRPRGIPPVGFAGLRDERGRPIRPAELRGRPVVVTFLYATCRDSCPLIAAQIRAALDELGRDVPVIAVSVDPANDTPRRARAFARRHRLAGRMRWALGDARALRRLWRAYGIAPQTADAEHGAWVVLLDGGGRQRVGFPASVLTPTALAHDIALLAREARGDR